MHGSVACALAAPSAKVGSAHEPLHVIVSGAASRVEAFDAVAHQTQALEADMTADVAAWMARKRAGLPDRSGGFRRCASTPASAASCTEVMDAILEEYYGGRADEFWERARRGLPRAGPEARASKT